jgi:hypothetical protein
MVNKLVWIFWVKNVQCTLKTPLSSQPCAELKTNILRISSALTVNNPRGFYSVHLPCKFQIIHVLCNFLNFWPCHDLLVSYHGGPGQSIWDLWWAKWHWDRFFSLFLWFYLVSSIPQLLDRHSYIIWGMDSRPIRGPVPQRHTHHDNKKTFGYSDQLDRINEKSHLWKNFVQDRLFSAR